MDMEVLKKASAACYSKTSSFQRNVGRTLISKLPVSQGAKILDLGCGTGELATELADLVGPECKIVAVDPDPDRIKLAKETNSRANIEFVVGSDTTFPEGQYDTVFMNCVIHWITDKDALYKRVYDNLSPGGSFGFSTCNGNNEILPITKKIFEPILPNFEDIYWKRVQFVTADVYEELRKSTAFMPHTSEIERRYVHCETADDCLNWFFGVLQGDMDLTSVNKEAIQKYDEEVRNNPMPFDMLFETIKKPSKEL